tara:strand:- start:277 stop:513 length:237 start_codon:yes stop_codon:yes gene_type:complete
MSIAKYNILKDGTVQNLTISNDFNAGRLGLMSIIGNVSTMQMRKVNNLLVGQSVIIKGYKIACRGKSPSFNEMRNNDK